jgi:hypothetical protein
MVIIRGNEKELKIINNILCDFNEHAVQYETDDGKTFLQTEEGFNFEKLLSPQSAKSLAS